jgi:hypothetical protein
MTLKILLTTLRPPGAGIGTTRTTTRLRAASQRTRTIQTGPQRPSPLRRRRRIQVLHPHRQTIPRVQIL